MRTQLQIIKLLRYEEVSYRMKTLRRKLIAPPVDIVWFDWREVEPLLKFIEDKTATTPMCFRRAETGEDNYVLVFSERPVSQQEANALYIQTIERSEDH